MNHHASNRPLIVGTAGHIDHGKTALIKLLTGVDTDRLKQEKDRGISIELGFTSLELPSKRMVGIVDVPGHERFIKNMLAGAGGIDLILFVIAADEGVMPQTREHMDIIDLLGVERGVVALTKVDMVEEDFVEIVEETVSEYLQETCLQGAPIVRVSAVTGEGKNEILRAVDEVASGVEVGQRGHLRRLPIDRVFTMEGFGTVVTGTLWAGTLNEGDPVRILPSGITTRIKSLEVHNARVPQALAGQRVAVSVHAVEKAAIHRGDWLLADEGVDATRLVDARLRVLRDARKPLANSARVRFHLGAAESLGRLILLEADELAPGQEGWAQLRLEHPVVTERGDRFVLRTYSPMHTVAGGAVVTAGVGKRRRFRREDIESVRQAEVGTPAERVRAVLGRRGPRGADRPLLAKETGCTAAEVEGAIEELVSSAQARLVGRKLIVSESGFAAAMSRLQGIVEGYQRGNPLLWGVQKSELKQRVETSMPADLVEAWVKQAVADGHLFVRSDRLRWGSDELKLDPAHAAIRDGLLETTAAAGFSGCTQREVIEGLETHLASGPHGAMTPAQRQKDAEALLLVLTDSGEITRVPPHFYFATSRLREVIERVTGFFQAHDEMKVADLKEMIGVSRKQAVPLLEYLDQSRVTQRRGDVRVAGPRLR